MPRHDYFLSRSKQVYTPGALIVPDTPLFVANNCKEGKFYLGDTDCGSDLELVALLFSKRIATEEYSSAEPGTPLGQLWFTPVSGNKNLPSNLTFYTVLKNSKSGKSGSLINFGQQATIAMSRGYDYREIIWMPKFVKKTGSVPKEDNPKELVSASWFVLAWEWREPTEEELKKIDQCVGVLESETDMDKLFDPVLETTTRCVDGMKPDAIAALVENLRANRAALPAPQ